MTWYIVTHEKSGYPILVYPDKERAELMVQKNGGKVVPLKIPNDVHIFDNKGKIIDHLYE